MYLCSRLKHTSMWSTIPVRRCFTSPARALGSAGNYLSLTPPVVPWENNICPAYFQRLLEDSSEPFYKVQSDLQIQQFYYY